MPDLNGLDLLRKIKLVKPKVRTILISGFNLQGDDVLEKYLNDGIVNKFIQKPMAVSSLRNEVNYQLHTYALSSK
jgi:YesN/AraC family two-component response regulator